MDFHTGNLFHTGILNGYVYIFRYLSDQVQTSLDLFAADPGYGLLIYFQYPGI
jgi:hypothetical protein